MKRIAAFLLLMALCTGCWDKREINQLALVDMVAADRDDKGNLLTYFQVLNPSSIQARQVGPAKAAVYTYLVQSRHIGDVPKEFSQKMSRRVFTSHLQCYVLSERNARHGIMALINYLEMNPERRTSVYTVVTDSSVSELTKNFTLLDRVPGRYIRLMMDWHSTSLGMLRTPSRMKDILNGIPRNRPVIIPIIHFNAKQSRATSDRLEDIDATREIFSIDGGAVFIRARMVGKITSAQYEMYFVLNHIAHRFFTNVQVQGQTVGLVARNIRVKRKWNASSRQLRLDVRAELQLIDNEQKSPLTPANQREIEQAFNGRFQQLAADFVAQSKARKWDMLGIGDTSYGRKEWSAFEVSFNVQSKVTLAGNTTTPYK
ncbi:Ger(x)C family spore germination protein [Paenibacillus sp. R14(2021)]|uniref:Ger(x)C family spore germination protein n=1 Tax=Paenibacillus sp. R14(2021) TaxID=2859228 RepID=UPI001C614CAB|nr:Ger(x)C family spore germination protein [Paenibacillus sp. R14(2021)]